MKLAKLSLAAIMTVGAMSAANATSLEESIKGVELSGYGHYRLHDASGAEAYSEVEVRAQLTAPVQENVQFVTRFTADASTATNATSGSADPMVDRVMFNYTGFDKTTVTLGRMYAGTPLDDTAALGLKVVSSPAAGLTLAAAYFHDNSAVTNALGALAVIYSNDMFNAKVWYVKAFEENTTPATTAVNLVTGAVEAVDAVEHPGAKFLFAELGANVGPVAVKGQYAQADVDGSDKAKTMRVQVSGKAGPVALRAGYIKNDEDGGDVTIDGSAEGDNSLIYGGIYGLVQNNEADAETMFIEAKAPVGPVTLKVGYVSYDEATYDSQYYGQIDYAVSKKFATYFRYGSADPVAAGDDKTLARFHAQYNF